MHYVLKHSMVVLMTARDESTSFKIFSTLNGRGVDLAVIDKLKPELLQVGRCDAPVVAAAIDTLPAWPAEQRLLRLLLLCLYFPTSFPGAACVRIKPLAHALRRALPLLNPFSPCFASCIPAQALPAGVRSQYAERWTALESSLGRPSFHALFEHFVVIEQAATTAVGSNSNGSKPGVNSSSGNGSKQDGSTGSRAVQKGFVPPGSSLLSHGSTADSTQREPTHSNGSVAIAAAVNSSGSASTALARPDVLQHFSNHPEVEAALDQVLQYGQKLLLLRANDWSALAAEGGSGEACFESAGMVT